MGFVSRNNRRWVRNAAVVASLAMALTACGGSKGGETGGGGGGGAKDAGKPQYGGKVTYALEAENAEGWCLPEAQLAIAGIQVARAIYDTLAIPNKNGELVPNLAKSLTPNSDFTEWNIELREGIKFHDGTALDATVVKNNLDAFRGKYPARKPLLFVFVFQNVKDVEVVDPLNVKVTTNSPWSSFPQALWSSGRIGMSAQAQLDDPETCDTKLIGTGPFMLSEWSQNEKFVAKKNPNYWQKDADGNQLPYLDEIEFRPMTEGSARVNALLAGDITMMHTPVPEFIDALDAAAEEGKITNTQSDKFTEVNFVQLNTSVPPFDNKNARLAIANALDMETLNQTRNLGLTKIANGPFAPGNMGYLKDTGYPTYNPEKAKKYLEAYKADTGQDLEFTLIATPDQATQATAALAQEMAKKAGIKVDVTALEQAALVSTAISGKFQAMSFRNFPGGDPDANYVWWYGTSPINFSRYNDEEINRLLDEGRATDDTAKRKQIYEDINKRFGSEAYGIWLYWAIWDVASATDVHGLFGAKLPNGDDPAESLVTGHSVAGLWVDQGKS